MRANIMSTFHPRVIEFLSDILQVDIPPDSDDLERQKCDEWDSINHLRLIMELEELLEISLDDEQVLELSSLRQIESLFMEHGTILQDEAGK